jgi:hypothetical protein
LSTEQPKSLAVFFLDKNHGLLIRDFLKRVKIEVKVHKTLGWLPGMQDADWIAECGKNDWAILSGDKKIEMVPEERQAVINAKCKVFMFSDSHETRTEDWIASFLVARARILKLVSECNGPFFVTLKPCGSVGHVSRPRFIPEAGGGWKIIDATLAPEVETTIKRKRRSQQSIFEFPSLQTALQIYVPLRPHCESCALLFGRGET